MLYCVYVRTLLHLHQKYIIVIKGSVLFCNVGDLAYVVLPVFILCLHSFIIVLVKLSFV